MSAIVSPDPQIQFVTPEEATRILTTCAFERQRRVRPAWVAELAEIIEAGSWMTTTITFAECAEDGKSYLVDGYHRLNAIVRAGKSAPLIIHLEPVQTLHDVGIVYSRLDRGLQRSIQDGLKARDLPTETGLSITTLRAGVAAVNVIRAGYRYDNSINGRRGYDEKFASIAEWLPELHLYAEATAGAAGRTKGRLLASSILSVGLTVFRYQPDKAADFFSSVATATNIPADSGKQAFITRLVMNAERVVVMRVTTMCRYVAACWNAHYAGKSLKVVRVYDTEKPIILLGTPLTKYQRYAEQSDV